MNVLNPISAKAKKSVLFEIKFNKIVLFFISLNAHVKDLSNLPPLSLVSLIKPHSLDSSTHKTYPKHEDKFTFVRLFHFFIILNLIKSSPDKLVS